MGRGITLRLLLIVVAALVGFLVLAVALRGVPGGLEAAGIDVGSDQGVALLRSVVATAFVRGTLALLLALTIAWLVGESASRLFELDRLRDPAARRSRWLQEAQDVADRMDRFERDQTWHFERITAERADLDRLVEALSEGIVQLAPGGRIVRANQAARRLLALPADAVGYPFPTVVRSAELRAFVADARNEAAPASREITFDERTLLVTMRPLAPDPVDAGRSPGVAIAIADLTALRRLESVRREFVANASHELKTPLTSIRGYAETLLDDGMPAETRRQFVATIAANAQRLQQIVDDLLDLSRLDSGAWQPRIETVGAGEIVNDTWQDFTARARDRDVRFDLAGDSDARLEADPSALRHILANLFDNALRYSARRGTIECRVTARPQEGSAAIEVRDDGPGIPADALPRIFERFYRVDPSRSRAEGGTGLGLAIVRHLTEAMHGRVEAESRLGHGTTIRVVLPLADGGARSPLVT